MTDPDHTKAAEKLLIAICGYRSNGEIDNLRVLPLIEAALLAAKRKGAVDALRMAEVSIRGRCPACDGSGVGGIDDHGSAVECEYCGRPMRVVRDEADRIEGEND